MRKRALAVSIVSSSAVIVVGWQIGAQAQAAQNASLAQLAPSEATSSAAPATTAPKASAGASSAPTASATPSVTPTATPSASAAAPAAPAAASGTFTGSVVNTRYGTVQVQITVSNGSITDVKALKLTDDGGRSVQISNEAAPILRQEVLAAQSANVDSVGGATYTSDAYLKSLQSALDQAGL